MSDNAWVSAHAFYHDDLDRLLLDVTAPLVAELAAGGLSTQYFFLRYWDGGPHLRLRVLPADESARAEVTRLVRERFEKYFAHRPATEQVTQEDYANSTRWLASIESVSAPAELYPNNSLAFIPYQREHAKYGVGASMVAVERHFWESSRIVLDLLRTTPAQDHRSTAAAAMILLTWFAATDDLTLLTDWTRRVPLLPGQPEPPPGTEEQGDRLLELARRMHALATRWHDADGDGTLLRWARSVGTLRETLEAQTAAGAPRPRPVFGVLSGCAHLVCNRLGVRLAEENVLRHRASRAVERLAGERGSA